MKYCGMDLHSNNCVVIVSDEDDRLVVGKRVPNDLGQICGALQPHREQMAGVVVEMPGVNYRERRIDSSDLLPVLTCCLT
jgi:hypothetical protein